MTHRQYVTWMVWLNEEEDKPTRSDYYQMQTAAEVRRLRAKNPEAVLIEQLKLNFVVDTGQQGGQEYRPEVTAETRKYYSNLSKQTWFARVGPPAKVITAAKE
jgi:hypothetical protein